jgi:hypothetical protein
MCTRESGVRDPDVAISTLPATDQFVVVPVCRRRSTSGDLSSALSTSTRERRERATADCVDLIDRFPSCSAVLDSVRRCSTVFDGVRPEGRVLTECDGNKAGQDFV